MASAPTNAYNRDKQTVLCGTDLISGVIADEFPLELSQEGEGCSATQSVVGQAEDGQVVFVGANVVDQTVFGSVSELRGARWDALEDGVQNWEEEGGQGQRHTAVSVCRFRAHSTFMLAGWRSAYDCCCCRGC